MGPCCSSEDAARIIVIGCIIILIGIGIGFGFGIGFSFHFFKHALNGIHI